MIDLIVEQNKAFNNCVKRDLPLDIDSMIDHLKSEVKEFERAPRIHKDVSLIGLSNIKDDKEFLLLHKMCMKDTKEGEAGDIINNLMSICELLSIDLELVTMITSRANSLRAD